MAIILDSVTFSDYPVWIDQYDYQEIPSTSYEGMDGTENVYVGQRRSQYPITLEGTRTYGWMKGSELSALRTLARDRDATYTLTYNGTYTVRFRHEVSGGPIQMEMLFPTAAPGNDTIYFGRIYLMCVG